MARLLSEIDGFAGIVRVTPLSGPNARSSGATTASDGSEQTFDSVGDVVAQRFDLNIKKGQGARRERGVLTALGVGGNAIRITFHDPDVMSPAEAGLQVATGLKWGTLPAQEWSNGEPWSNGEGWHSSAPTIAVSVSAVAGSSEVKLVNEFWGHLLGVGDHLGFFPFSLGLYTVTEVIADGHYRIWPRLRTALTTSHYATLFPTLVMKPRPGVKPPARGLVGTDGSTIDLVEVVDSYVRSAFGS